MKRVAIYSSVLYGADFITESISSIRPYVDEVYIILMKRPWGRSTGTQYKGQTHTWPERFDDTEERVNSLRDRNIKVILGYKYTPWCRWAYALTLVFGRYRCDANEIVFLDPDCVIAPTQAQVIFKEWDNNPQYPAAQVDQIELWKTHEWMIRRPRRMVSLHRGDLTALPGNPYPCVIMNNGVVHNLGFCLSKQAMEWRHLVSMAMTSEVGEAIPNQDWLEKKWVAWHPINNNHDLENSLGDESAIPFAEPYFGPKIPDQLIERIREIRSKD